MTPWPALAFLVFLAAPSDAPKSEGLQSSPEQRLRFAKQAAERYRFRVPKAMSRMVKVRPQPLLRWNNEVVREDDGMLFLWAETGNGRPVAAAQFFLVDRQWHHEFQSLIAEPMEARNAHDDWTWGPTEPGLRWQKADDQPVAGDSAAQRLRQMKLLAGQFTAAVDQNADFDGPEQLRLLATPLYRYSSPDDQIVDGAVFAFVQGTNPEILFLVEAVASSPEHKRWRYGFARMSCFNLRVYRDGKVVWSEERAPVPTPDKTSPYFFRWLAEKDRSGEIAMPVDPRGRDDNR